MCILTQFSINSKGKMKEAEMTVENIKLSIYPNSLFIRTTAILKISIWLLNVTVDTALINQTLKMTLKNNWSTFPKASEQYEAITLVISMPKLNL